MVASRFAVTHNYPVAGFSAPKHLIHRVAMRAKLREGQRWVKQHSVSGHTCPSLSRVGGACACCPGSSLLCNQCRGLTTFHPPTRGRNRCWLPKWTCFLLTSVSCLGKIVLQGLEHEDPLHGILHELVGSRSARGQPDILDALEKVVGNGDGAIHQAVLN